MKKNYINPKTTCIEVELEQLIADSLTGNGLNGTGYGGKTSDQPTGFPDGGEVKAQGSFNWDNEW